MIINITQKTETPNGYLLWENSDIVCLAILESTNDKTGNMIQIYFLVKAEKPHLAVKSGLDSKVCFDCPKRGEDCYVVTFQGPRQVWISWTLGKYPYLPMEDYPKVFGARETRFGAYGDPVSVPFELLAAIAAASQAFTGYTHQWAKAGFQQYRALLMASADSQADRLAANALGWRAFRVRPLDDTSLPQKGEISCPASDEMARVNPVTGEKTRLTQCIACRLCNGNRGETRAADPRKDLVIKAHGQRAKRFRESTVNARRAAVLLGLAEDHFVRAAA
jgi:hypothetical protein